MKFKYRDRMVVVSEKSFYRGSCGEVEDFRDISLLGSSLEQYLVNFGGKQEWFEEKELTLRSPKRPSPMR